MNRTAHSLALVAGAAALALLAWLTAPSLPRAADLADIGEPLFPDFTDPHSAAGLEVVAYDPDAARHRAFSVALIDGRWVIPSNSNYPVDNAAKMGEAASAFIGLRRESLVTNQPADHAALGVLAPEDESAAPEGRGVRVALRDPQGRTLIDLIIGRAPDGSPQGSPESARRYVRIPGQNAVYVATIGAGFSTKFTDWIDTDLLRLRVGDIDRLVFDRYSVDEAAGVRVPGERIDIARLDPAPQQPRFSVVTDPGGPPGAGERVDDARVDEALRDLVSLRIVGVRPKPPALAAMLVGGEGASASLTSSDILSLASRGFFVTSSGGMLANDGEVRATTGEGLVYTLWLGEARLENEPDAAATLDAPTSAGAPAESRYVFVTVAFDEAALPPEPAPEAPAGGADPPAPPAQSPARLGAIERGKARAAELSERFAGWFFLVDAGVIDRLRLARPQVIVPIEPPAAEAPVGPATPPG